MKGKKMADKLTVDKVFEQIKQIAADSYDGSPLKIGLKREEADKMHNRVMDAYSVSFAHPDMLRVKYSSQVKLADIHGNGIGKQPDFEGDTYGMVDSVKNFIQKEYKSRTGKSLSLKELKDKQEDIDVQYISRINTYCTTAKWYKISSGTTEEEKVDGENKNISDFLKAFKEKPAKPKNDTRKNEKNEK